MDGWKENLVEAQTFIVYTEVISPLLSFKGTWSKISSKVGLLSGCSFQQCFMSWMHSKGAKSGLTTGRHRGGGLHSFSIISKAREKH